MDWAALYPAFAAKETIQEQERSTVTSLTQDVEVADIGCGFGGLLFALAPKMPETLILGTIAI